MKMFTKAILSKGFAKVKEGSRRKADIYMRETGEMIKLMEKECRNGLMGSIMKVTL